jgi:hypothetical protein
VQRHGYMYHNFDNNKEMSYEDIPMSLSVSWSFIWYIYYRFGLFSRVKVYNKMWIDH